MKVTILHLSDLHIKGARDPILRRDSDIASVCFEAARNSDACLVVITGDIAFGGTPTEYEAATGFLGKIREAIKRETKKTVHIITLPGNHDCALIPENRARTVVIDGLISDESLASDPSVIEHCTSSQKAYFEFREAITDADPVYSHPLWTEHEIAFGGKLIRISAINASWMSRNPELQGQLVFPVEMFYDVLSQPASFRLALLHHPLNWYTQSSYHPLRKALRTHANMILSGHEHAVNSGSTSEVLAGENLFFEAAALQPHSEEEEAGFAVLTLDLGAATVLESRFAITVDAVTKRGQSIEHSLSPSNRGGGETGLTSEFEQTLRDPGGNFSHPEKDNIELDEIFVYPDLQELTGEKDDDISVQADTVISRDHTNQRVLFLGEDKAGKSTLLMTAFKEYHRRGLVPLLLTARDFSSMSEKEIAKQIERRAAEQYVRPEIVARTPAERRIALLDDVDRLRLGSKALHRVIVYLEKHFSAVLLSASSGFEFAELVHKEASEALKPYRVYQILRFGYRLRRQLIKKWCLCGNITTTQDLDRRVHLVEQLLNSVVGRNLVPSQPIYLLILLQSHERQQQAEIQSSSFAHYYQYLITKSLKEAGVKPDHLNEFFNYLAHLAWFYRHSELREADTEQLRQFNRAFSQRFISVDFKERVDILTHGKILSKRGNDYAFAYPYIYFFFVGKYLADNLHLPEMKTAVAGWCAKLNILENAHAVLFLTHHRNDPWVIEQIAAVLKGCFSKHAPMKFDGDISSINKLIDCTSELLLSEPNVDVNQDQVRRQRDEIEKQEELYEKERNELPEALELLERVYLLIRTAEILGQILKNYYGSLERPVKAELLREVFDGPLRMLRGLIDEIAGDPDSLVGEIESILESGHPKLKIEDKRDMARKIGFHFLGMICTGVVAKTAQLVAADKLQEDVSNAVREESTIAYRMIEAATRLMRPGDIAVDQIRKLAEDLKSNAFGFTMLQSLAAMHIHLFHTSDADKQRLCEHLKITMAASRAADFINPGRKLLERPR